MGSLDFSFLPQYKDFFIQGAVLTVQIAFFTVLLGVIVGTLVALLRLSKNPVIKFLSAAYVEFLRGTPVLVQVYIVGLGLPAVFPAFQGLARDHMVILGVIALSINSSAYVAEIMRSGIQSIDKGQTEAARSLGMSNIMTMRYVILPQAFKNILPALGNEFVVDIKESSIVSVLGIAELMYNGNIVRGNTFKPFEPLLIVAILYFIMTFTVSKLLGILERKLRESDVH